MSFRNSSSRYAENRDFGSFTGAITGNKKISILAKGIAVVLCGQRIRGHILGNYSRLLKGF